MENRVCTTEAPAGSRPATYDSASLVEVVKAIDLAMRHYFDDHHWLVTRNRLFPGLRPRM